MTTNDSGRIDKMGLREANVGDNVSLSPIAETVGIWRTSRLFGAGGGIQARDGIISARPGGVEYAVRTDPLRASLLVPWESRPTRLKPAPALVCKGTTAVASWSDLDQVLDRRPKLACSARS
jgi:hypothetical protein